MLSKFRISGLSVFFSLVCLPSYAVTNTELGSMVLGFAYEGETQDYLQYYSNGETSYNVYGPSYHPGIDYIASAGNLVYSPIDGTVTRVQLANSSTGSMNGKGIIAIKANDSDKRFFVLHMSTSFVREGDTVSQGCVLGYSGTTGAAAAHLHVEVRDGTNYASYYFTDRNNTGTNEDPADYINSYSPVYATTPCH